MSQRDALIERLLSKPKDFTLQELDRLMGQCHCEKDSRGRTSGSAINYCHVPTKRVFSCHRPHPGSIIKPYLVKEIIQFLREIDEIQ